MFSVSPQKLFSFSGYLSFCLDFLVMYQKDFIKKIKVNIKVNFKFYDVIAWLINNCNTHTVLPNILRFLFFFSFLLAEVLLNLVTPLDSAVPCLDFEQINVFWTSGFDSVSIVFDSLSVSRSLLELYFSHSI